MFQEQLDLYTYISANDTVELVKIQIEFSQPHIDKCNKWDPLDHCHCENSYKEVYNGNRSQFENQVWVSYDLGEPKSFSYGYLISFKESMFYGGVDFQNTDIDKQINEMLTEEILIGNKTLFDVFVFESSHEYTNSYLTFVIKPNKGLVGFMFNEENYLLIE